MAHRGSSSQHFPFASFPVRNGPTPRKLPGAAPTSRSELTTATATGSAGASRLGGLAKSAATARRGAVEEEYVRNLQQQVYLLELETRYL